MTDAVTEAGSPTELYQKLQDWFSSFSSVSWSLLFSAVLVVLVVLAYSNSLNAPFVFDDIQTIKNNELITRFDAFTLENIKRFWISKFDRGRPVALFTFALNYCFGGFSPVGYHLVNLLIHILSGIGVFVVTRLLLVESPVLLDSSNGDYGDLTVNAIAGLTSLIWTLHPVQTASVTYLVQRMSALAGMFYFWGLYFYLRRMNARTQLKRWGFFLLTVLFFFLGLGSKEIVATLPIAIWLIEWVFFPDDAQNQLPRWVHFGGVFLFFVLMGLYFLVGNEGIIETLKSRYRYGGPSPRHWSTVERLMTESRIVLRYLIIALLPLPHLLNLDRYPDVSTGLLSPPTTLISVIVILSGLLIALSYRKTYPVFSFAMFWFGLHLVITSTVIPLELMYDHRLYLPLFGPVFFVVYLFVTSVRIPSMYRLGIGGLVPLLLVTATYVRNMDWSSQISVYRDVVQKTPRNPRGHSNLGVAYSDKADVLIEKNQYDRAFGYLQKAKKRFERARRILKEQQYKETGKIHVKLNQLHILLAFVELERGKVEKAFSYLTYIDPSDTSDMPGMVNPVLQALVVNGKYKEAIRKSLNILSRYPNNTTAYLMMAESYIERERPETARHILKRTPEIDHTEGRLRANLLRGRILMQLNKLDRARERLQSVLDEGADIGSKNRRLTADIHKALAQYHHQVTGNRTKRGKHARKAVQILQGNTKDPEIQKWANQHDEPDESND